MSLLLGAARLSEREEGGGGRRRTGCPESAWQSSFPGIRRQHPQRGEWKIGWKTGASMAFILGRDGWGWRMRSRGRRGKKRRAHGCGMIALSSAVLSLLRAKRVRGRGCGEGQFMVILRHHPYGVGEGCLSTASLCSI